MALSGDTVPSEFAVPMQTDPCEGEPLTKRPRVNEGLADSSAVASSGRELGQPAQPSLHMRRVDQRRWISSSEGRSARTTGPLQRMPLRPTRTTRECQTANPFPLWSGNDAVIAIWTWPWIHGQDHFPNQWWLVTSAIALAAS
eukprot:2809830-Amphidinium_carterae.1